jgi:DNA modification methylase/transcriptional regulator with XRE-family HTH domain
MKFGSFIRERRNLQGLSLRAAAVRVGVDAAYLSRVEAGKTPPSRQFVERLAPIVGCSVDELALMAGHLPQRVLNILESDGYEPSSVLRELAACVAEPPSDYEDHIKISARRGARTTAPPSTPSLFSSDDVMTEGEGSDGAPERRVADPRNQLNDLTSTEWIPETVSVWTQRGLGAGHRDAQIERQHPAPFSFTDVARLIRFFSKSDETVLDPFVGVGSTLKACALEGRRGIGIELNPKYAALARERLRKEIPAANGFVEQQRIVEGDARIALKALPASCVDFVVTSPPYWTILHKEDHKARQERRDHSLDTRYGDDARDLGNIEGYADFLEALSTILQDCGRVLKRRKYMAIVVSDFRDKSRFIMFHADLAAALARRGFGLRGIKVLYQRHKRIFPYGYPYAYVPNLHHQYILVMQNER